MTTENYTLNKERSKFKNESEEFIKVLKSPRSTIVLASKYGVSSFSKVVGVYFLYAVINTGFIGVALLNWYSSHFSSANGRVLTTVIIVGILSTVYASTRAYKNFTLDILTKIYKELLAPIFKKLSSSFVQNSDAIRTGEFELKQKEIKKVLRTGKFINEQKQRLPKVLQKGVWLLLKQIPIIGMLAEIDETVRQENKEKASEELFHKMDAHIENKLLNKISFKWIFWLFPLNIIVQVYFLYYWLQHADFFYSFLLSMI